MQAVTRKAGILGVGILLACAAGAWAHAFLDHADPKVGSEVAAPGEVKIWFTEEIEPAFSSIEVRDAAGNQVDRKDFHVDTADKKLGIVSVGSLPAGTYKVVWHVVATDTHKTQGDFTFKVKGGAASRPATTGPAMTGPSTAAASQPATQRRAQSGGDAP